MIYEDNTYIKTNDLMFRGVLNDIKKSRLALQPIFEAFTNAIEAIKDKQKRLPTYSGKIIVDLFASETTDEKTEFHSLTINDNGIGFNDEQFKRWNTFKDFTKGYKNLGSGRLQFAHHFDRTIINSTFVEGNQHFQREFVISKSEDFLAHNAIVLHKQTKKSDKNEEGTSISFKTLLEPSNIYNNLNDITLKEHLIDRYVHYFCYNKFKLPTIIIRFYVQNELRSENSISDEDIPSIDKSEGIILPYSRISENGKAIELLKRTEKFTIDVFKIKKEILKSNILKLVSKGEIVDESNIELQSIAGADNVNGYKYLFLVSGDYIDSRDSNLRGILSIPDKETFSKNTSIFATEEILLEDIQEGVNSAINFMYPEIEQVRQNHEDQLQKLKEMFLLDSSDIDELEISINDSENKILEKFYSAEAKKAANIDATIKESIDNLDKIDTTSEQYGEELKKATEKLVNAIPLQNKNSLAHYVARRKLVLDLFGKVLERELDVQNKGTRNFDEALIHNLIFQQGSSNPEDSDLWIINEDFIYFKGSSEKTMSQTEINGERLFKAEFSIEEEKYLKSLGENRKLKRPDILLFPDEGKCIIIEFKTPDENASDHLTQIDFYANLILNYSIEKVQINTFYGFLIGENIEPRDVMGRVSGYEHSYQFDYLFRPSEKVNGFDGRSNGSIYTEVIKYSTLLERARRRNKIFTEKLR